MPINAGPEFFAAEKRYLSAKTLRDKIYCLEELIRAAPKHKSSENLLKELRTRLKKLKQKSEKGKKKGGKKGIRKEGFQCILLGLPNSGKSSILKKITNAKPKISPNPFSTTQPEIGTLNHKEIKAQIIDLPSINSDQFDSGIANTADCLILVIQTLSELKEIESLIKDTKGKKIVVFSKTDYLSQEKKRKLLETIKSKKINGVMVSSLTGCGIDKLKQKIYEAMEIIRIYPKEPGKSPGKLPIVLPKNSTVKDVAEKIKKGFSKHIKETRLTGPSSKFPNQRVGLSHKLKDKDTVEFHTKG